MQKRKLSKHDSQEEGDLSVLEDDSRPPSISSAQQSLSVTPSAISARAIRRLETSFSSASTPLVPCADCQHLYSPDGQK